MSLSQNINKAFLTHFILHERNFSLLLLLLPVFLRNFAFIAFSSLYTSPVSDGPWPKTFTYSLFTAFIIYTHDNSNSATIIFCFLHIFICRQSPQTKKTISDIHAFFISNIFISNARLKSAKNQANAKQHSEAELLLFENYSHSSPTLSSKNNRTYSTYSKK